MRLLFYFPLLLPSCQPLSPCVSPSPFPPPQLQSEAAALQREVAAKVGQLEGLEAELKEMRERVAAHKDAGGAWSMGGSAWVGQRVVVK
jgi:hypothetical protein